MENRQYWNDRMLYVYPPFGGMHINFLCEDQDTAWLVICLVYPNFFHPGLILLLSKREKSLLKIITNIGHIRRASNAKGLFLTISFILS